MQLLKMVLPYLLVACSQLPKPPLVAEPVIHDAIAQGKVKASAVRREQHPDVCFDIQLSMQEVSKEYAQASNWTLAWLDHQDRYHLLNWSGRDPSSEPKSETRGQGIEWTNHFRTCVEKTAPSAVKAILLTPKTLPFREDKGLALYWP